MRKKQSKKSYIHGQNIQNMITYTQTYLSPLGEILLASDGTHLTGLWFKGQKYEGSTLNGTLQTKAVPALQDTERWLDHYFNGKQPDFLPPLRLQGTTFRRDVWQLLLHIPYGQFTTYRELSARLAAQRGATSFSAQAIGGAIGHNPISIIVPCHRVIGADGSLKGYAGGLDRKERLLRLEGCEMPLSPGRKK